MCDYNIMCDNHEHLRLFQPALANIFVNVILNFDEWINYDTK